MSNFDQALIIALEEGFRNVFERRAWFKKEALAYNLHIDSPIPQPYEGGPG